jgi:hypothetical protein
METLKSISALGWIGIVILFNSTLLGGASQLADLTLSVITIKIILAAATLANGFLGGLVIMFGGQGAQIKNVLAMPGVERISVNSQANGTLATIAVDPNQSKIAPTPGAQTEVIATAKAAA